MNILVSYALYTRVRNAAHTLSLNPAVNSFSKNKKKKRNFIPSSGFFAVFGRWPIAARRILLAVRQLRYRGVPRFLFGRETLSLIDAINW